MTISIASHKKGQFPQEVTLSNTHQHNTIEKTPTFGTKTYIQTLTSNKRPMGLDAQLFAY